ncbi:hydrogen peroxide-inducible genes activator [bacterium BMS3Abin03]|nr:hydrogen peroxide-inducible genes activator [bacterium BMS3Abin03]
MTLTQLEYIVAVANHKSFSEAAQHCFVTQPTLSMQIQKLEDELGVIIFDRSKHPVTPTEVGEKVLKQARVILQESTQLQNIVSTETGEFAGRLRIGVIPTVAPYLLPMFLNSFIKKYPGLEVIVNEIITDEIVGRLNKDLIDVGILAFPINKAGIVEDSLYFEPFVGYIPKTHSLSNKADLTIDDINVQELLLLEEGHCLRDQILKICDSSERDLSHKTNKVLFESGNLDTLKNLVEQEFGITLLPYLALQYITDKKKRGLLREFSPPVPRREIGFVYNKTIAKKKLISELKKEILAVIPEELKETKDSLIVH